MVQPFLIQKQVDAITSRHLPSKASMLSRPRTEHTIILDSLIQWTEYRQVAHPLHGILFCRQFLSLVTKNLVLSYFVLIWTPVPQKCYSQTVVFLLNSISIFRHNRKEMTMLNQRFNKACCCKISNSIPIQHSLRQWSDTFSISS